VTDCWSVHATLHTTQLPTGGDYVTKVIAKPHPPSTIRRITVGVI